MNDWVEMASKYGLGSLTPEKAREKESLIADLKARIKELEKALKEAQKRNLEMAKEALKLKLEALPKDAC